MSIEMTKGQTRTYKFTWRNKVTKDLIDLTLYTLYLTVADNLCPTTPAIALSTTDTPLVFFKDPDQIGNKGISFGKFLPSATAGLKAPKSYVYDTWAVLDADNQFPGLQNQPFKLNGSVTILP